jgi:hypothetical protein
LGSWARMFVFGRIVGYADVGDKKRSEITLEKSACDSDHDETTEKIACTMRVSRSSALSKSDPGVLARTDALLKLTALPATHKGAARARPRCPQGSPHAGGDVVVTGWPGEISSSELQHVARCDGRYLDRRPTRMAAVATKTPGFALFSYLLVRDQCELAQVVIIKRALSVGGLI